MEIKKAIILAGGIGERLKPLTDKTPKPLLPVNGKPVVQYVIENLRRCGVEEVILSIGYKADKIKEYFGDGSQFGIRIGYCIEDEPLGTGGAVKKASEGFEEPFILVWGDNLTDVNFEKVYDVYKRNNALVTFTLTPREDVEHFGVAELDGEKIVRFVEKPKREEAPSNLINAGAFIIDPSVLDILPEGKSNIERECFEKLAGRGGDVYAYRHTGYWFPTDTLEKYKKAEEQFNPKGV